MLAAWSVVTDGNLFPLCRSTAFKLSFEGSINKGHSDRVAVQESLYHF
jgi:hypothetical protein